MSLNDFLGDVRSFLSPRQRPGPTDDDDGLTVIAVTTMTAPQTFDGDAILVTESPSMFAGGAVAGGAVFATRTPGASTSAAEETEAPLIDSSSPTVPAQTSVPILTPESTPINDSPAFGVTSSLSGARATSSNAAPASEGLSGGAKAGIAFGVLIPLAALLIGALLLIRRKKQQAKNAGERLDDEKSAMSAMPPSSFPASNGGAPAPAMAMSGTPLAHAPVIPQVQVRSSDSLSAPRLSLRPQSQFNALGHGGPSSGNGAAMAAGAIGATAVGAAAIAKAPHSPTGSAWERPGNEKNANDPANPFGNHAETSVAMANAAPATQARAPSPEIAASDFPLPGSVAPSEKAISIAAFPSTDNVSMAPTNPAAASTMSLAAPSTPASSLGMAAAAAAGVAAGGAVAAGASNRNSPPPAPVDNVYRVQLDFKPSMEDELEIRAGQLVRMLHSYDDGWVGLYTIHKDHISEHTLTQSDRHSACAWTARNKASSHAPAFPRTASSPAPVPHPSSAAHHAVPTPPPCAAPHHQDPAP